MKVRPRAFWPPSVNARIPNSPPTARPRWVQATAPNASAPTNFPQGRCTDHRINLTLYSLDRIMEGELTPLFDALSTAAQTEALKAQAGD